MKRDKIIAGAVIVYFITALGIYCVKMNSVKIDNNTNNILLQEEQPQEVQEAPPQTENVEIVNTDTVETILSRHSLPSLERMDKEDQDKYVNNLRVIKRIDELKLDTIDMLRPEVFITDIDEKVDGFDERYYAETIVFDGSTSQELQQVINEHSDALINIVSEKIEITDTIVLHSNLALNGNGVCINAQGVNYGFLADNAYNLCINDIHIEGGLEYGLYFDNCNNVKVTKCSINKCGQKAVSIVGKTDGLVIDSNKMSDNQSGALYLAGNVAKGLIVGNTISNNYGASGMMAGIVLTNAASTDNKDTNDSSYTLAESPHSIIIRNNKIENNESAGIFADGAYMCYLLNNAVYGNEKEGISLCNETLGFYISNNTLRFNGGRGNKTEDELSGISLENTAYNILENNNISDNYGGGINMLNTSIRNIVMGNVINDNNASQNDALGFYGIKLGTGALEMEGAVLDAAADYENIICRNVISGNHYSGIFIDRECYINDVFDNVIMDSQLYGVEAVSLKFNSIINNTTNCGVHNEFQ